MKSWHEILCHLLNFIFAFITVILYIYSRRMRAEKIKQLPKNIRYYLVFCCFPFSIIISFLSIATSILFFLNTNENFQKTTTTFLAFAFQQFRFSLLLLAVERVLATILLERYGRCSSGMPVFVGMYFSTYFLTVIYVFLTFNSATTSFTLMDYEIYFVLILHAITLILCKIIHFTNDKLYRLLAYKNTFQKRQQIVENIKVLKFLWPTIFIFAVFAPIGPFVAMIYKVWTNSNAPTVFTQLSYNFSFMIMMGYRIHKNLAKKRTSSTLEKSTISVKNPFGKEIPTNIQMEIYFEQLQNQWS